MAQHLEGTGNEFDLITGRAGAIVGLLALQDLLGEPGLLERAGRFGEELIVLAVKRARSWSWPSPGAPPLRLLPRDGRGRVRFLRAGARNQRRGLPGRGREGIQLRAAPVRRPGSQLARSAGRGPERNPGGAPRLHDRLVSRAPGIALSHLRAYELTARLPIVTRQSWPSRRPAVMSKPSPRVTQETIPLSRPVRQRRSLAAGQVGAGHRLGRRRKARCGGSRDRDR
jgi:hypothetical protein